MTNQFSSKQFGFTLIEAMVSLVVISVGMIGMAALYGQGLGMARTAIYRTLAINLAADMADRIRANRVATTAYNGPAADNSCDPGGGVACTPEQMASHDLWVWTTLQIPGQMPNGAGTVQMVGTNPPTYTITVSWDEVGIGPVNYQSVIQVPRL